MTIQEWLVSDSTVLLKIGATRLNQLFSLIDSYKKKYENTLNAYESLLIKNKTLTYAITSLRNKQSQSISTLRQENTELRSTITDMQVIIDTQIRANKSALNTLEKYQQENNELIKTISSLKDIEMTIRRF